jgi:hypothetical protein
MPPGFSFSLPPEMRRRRMHFSPPTDKIPGIEEMSVRQ